MEVVGAAAAEARAPSLTRENSWNVLYVRHETSGIWVWEGGGSASAPKVIRANRGVSGKGQELVLSSVGHVSGLSPADEGCTVG